MMKVGMELTIGQAQIIEAALAVTVFCIDEDLVELDGVFGKLGMKRSDFEAIRIIINQDLCEIASGVLRLND